jgi:hypothetical protein
LFSSNPALPWSRSSDICLQLLKPHFFRFPSTQSSYLISRSAYSSSTLCCMKQQLPAKVWLQ